MELSKRIRDLRYGKGWAPTSWQACLDPADGPVSIERGNTSKPQAGPCGGSLGRMGVPLEVLLDMTPSDRRRGRR